MSQFPAKISASDNAFCFKWKISFLIADNFAKDNWFIFSKKYNFLSQQIIASNFVSGREFCFITSISHEKFAWHWTKKYSHQVANFQFRSQHKFALKIAFDSFYNELKKSSIVKFHFRLGISLQIASEYKCIQYIPLTYNYQLWKQLNT